MRYLKIILPLLVTLSIVIGCEDTNENLVGDRGVGVVPTISNISSEAIYNFASDMFTFTVDSLPEGVTVDKAEIEIVYGDYSGTLMEISSFPADVEFSAAEILSTLGITEDDVVLGTSIYVYVLTTNQGVASRSYAAVKLSIPCEFDPTLAYGNYNVESDWYATGGGSISIAKDDSDPYVVHVSDLEVTGDEGLVEDNGPLELVINSEDYSVSCEYQLISSDAWGYGPMYYEGTGIFNSCSGEYKMVFTISLPDIGYSDTYPYVFTRK